MNDEEYVSTGDGNKFLGKVCDSLFYKTGNIGYYELSKRLTEPSQVFDNNFNQEQDLEQ